MEKVGQRSAIRRALTLIEILVVLLMIGLLTTGGLVLGKRALQSSTVQGEARRLGRKIQNARVVAVAEERPIFLSLQPIEGRWKGVFEGRNTTLRSFYLRCDQIFVDGHPKLALGIEIDEHGGLSLPQIELLLGHERAGVSPAY